MKNTDIDNLVRKHKAILGLPQGFGKKSVKDKTTILTGKARSKNPALASFVKEFNDLKTESKETGPSARGGKGGKGGASYTGRQRATYKKPPEAKKTDKGQPKAPPKPKKPPPKKPEPEKPKPKPKPKPAPKKPKKYETGDDPKFDKELGDILGKADEARAKKVAKKREDTKTRTEPKPKPRGPRPKKLFTDTGKATLGKPKGQYSVAEIPAFKPKKSKEPIEELLTSEGALKSFVADIPALQGAAGGSKPVPTIKESDKEKANVFNTTLENLVDEEPVYVPDSPGYVPADSFVEPIDFTLDNPRRGFGGGGQKRSRPKTASSTPRGPKFTTISSVGYKPGESLYGRPGERIDDETGMPLPGQLNPFQQLLKKSETKKPFTGRLY